MKVLPPIQSGSNGPISKEESPLLGWRPILVLRLRCVLLCHEHGLNQSGNLLDDPVHAHGRIHGRIHFVMMRAGVQDQNPGSSVRLLHHVGQVMRSSLESVEPRMTRSKAWARRASKTTWRLRAVVT